jgi:YidC/Oxa1 family membrane protein insertase
MQPKIDRIKRNFKREEQYFILSSYYRQNHYHPIMALRGSLSLLLQIPFFIAAYHFLSHYEPLRGQPFLFIRNLGAPDALLSIGALKINLLPLLMTAINIISGVIYTKGNGLQKEKIQLYAMALFFLVILYNSPAALVLYWTCNNIISLIKNIILKTKYSKQILFVLIAVLLACSCIYVAFFRRTGKSHHIYFVIAAVFLSIFILSLPFIIKNIISRMKKVFYFLKNEEIRLKSVFIITCITFGILCGIFIPFNITASDPAEFSFIKNESPFNVLVSPMFVSLGLFCLWPLYIFLSGNKVLKAIGAFFMSFVLFYGLANAFLFHGQYGMLSQQLTFPEGTDFTVSKPFLSLNLAAGFLILTIILLFFRFNKLKQFSILCSVALISLSLFSITKAYEINKGFVSYKSVLERNSEGQNDILAPAGDLALGTDFSLSKNGQNVFIIMLDKASGIYFLSVLNEHERLKSSFEGFVYYPNTVSYFRSTILGAPPLLGGYEYTPEALHLRNNESMKDKYTEACLVLPELFKKNDYSVSVYDLPYVNFQTRMDTTFFTEKGMNAGNLEGKYTGRFIRELGDNAPVRSIQADRLLQHNFTLFGVFLTSPVIFRNIIYNKGNYWSATSNSRVDVVKDIAVQSYAALRYLPELTDTENKNDTFTLMVSNMAHDPSFLQYPDYTVVSEITDFGPDLFNGNINSHQYYHINNASYLLLEKWFDFLKENGVYDNTRIIIVSDHAEVLADPSGMLGRDYTSYNPVLLFKDFDSSGDMEIDFSFMTNADVPSMAVRNLIPDAVNPFTGNGFSPQKDEGVYIYLGGSSQTQDYTGTAALSRNAPFYHVKDNIFDANNWTKITKRY